MKIVKIEGLWLLHWRTKFHIDISHIGHIHTHAHTHTHASGRQLKITFLDVLNYSEYSDTDISKKKIFTKTASSVRKQKTKKIQYLSTIGYST